MTERIHLGFEVGTGEPVSVPLAHMAVTGQTQMSGKTTTLEALVDRANVSALAFVTKRGERAFANGQRVTPYFRDRADWQFVTSIIDATLQEKNKFLRPWIMKICRTTRSLADVQIAVRHALVTAKGLNEGVYTQLDAYLDLIVPEIERSNLARSLDLGKGLNVMDVSGSPTPMQMLFVQSAIDRINEHFTDTVVIVPEAWEFVPEGKGSPVKSSAVNLVRKGAAIGNFIWVDSQDMAGVDKVVLRGCTVWLIGVQREANEIKRNLSNIPTNVKKPTAAQVALLERGQFYACFGPHAIRTYVQPAWMTSDAAQTIARGEASLPIAAPRAISKPIEEPTVNEREARELRETNARLEAEINDLREKLTYAREESERLEAKVDQQSSKSAPATGPSGNVDEDALYQNFKSRILREPSVLRVLASKPEIEVQVERKQVTMDEFSLPGRVAKLIAKSFFRDPKTGTAVRSELKRTGTDVNTTNLSRTLGNFVRDGFLTEEGNGFVEVAGMKVRIVER